MLLAQSGLGLDIAISGGTDEPTQVRFRKRHEDHKTSQTFSNDQINGCLFITLPGYVSSPQPRVNIVQLDISKTALRLAMGVPRG